VKNLIKLDGKAVEKLIDVVSKGIGTVYKPRAMRNEADAEAYKIEAIAKAEAKKELIKNEVELEIVDRTKMRVVHHEVNRQENLENIVEKSITHLEENVTDEQVDEDWRTRFFQKAQDVSNEEMQDVWARILASEVSKPGCVSFRTLEVISNVSKGEAELFSVACKLASGCARIWKIGNNTAFESYNISYNHLMQLREAGLVYDSDSLIVNHTPTVFNNETICVVNIGDKHYLFSSLTEAPLQPFALNQVAFTNAGVEICKLIGADPHDGYFSDVIAEMGKKYKIEEIKAKKV